MKVIGIIFVVLTTGSLGFRIAGEHRKQCEMLRQLSSGLRILRNEIAFCGTPLSKAFAMMAVPCNGVLEKILSNTAREMDRHAWLPPTDALEQCASLYKNEMYVKILLDMLSCFGSYDVQSQLRSVDWAIEKTEEHLCLLEQERQQKGKVYETLGICAGVAVSIFLI